MTLTTNIWEKKLIVFWNEIEIYWEGFESEKVHFRIFLKNFCV